MPTTPEAPAKPADDGALRTGRSLPRITIVTPSFNQGRFIEGTIRSVLGQEYPNLEFMVFDGGSTDETVDILRAYDKDIDHWVSAPDGGQSQAINAGLGMATGDVFNWLNSDDRLEPGALFRVAEAWTGNPDAAAWVGGCRRVDGQGRELNVIMPNGMTLDNMGENWNGRQFYQPSCFMNAALVRRMGGVDPGLSFCMDLHLWLRLAALGRFVPGRGVWSCALIHADAKTQHQRKAMHRETVRAIASMGFERGAASRSRHALHGAPHEYVLPKDLEAELAGINDPNSGALRPLGGLRIAVVDFPPPQGEASQAQERPWALARLMRESGADLDHFRLCAGQELPSPADMSDPHVRSLPEDAAGAASAVAAAGPDAVWMTGARSPNHLALQGEILGCLRSALPGAFLVLDAAHLRSRGCMLAYALTRNPDDLLAARRFLDLERLALPAADAVLAANEAEKTAMEEAVPETAPVCVMPRAHVVATRIDSPHARAGLLLAGDFRLDQDADAARHFAADILPSIRARMPGATLTCAGPDAGRALADLASDAVRLADSADDPTPLWGTHRIFVRPLRFGAEPEGLTGRAAAAGLPMVVSSLAAQGLGLADGEHCFVADDPVEFALKVLHLYDDPFAWTNFSLRSWLAAAHTASPRAAADALDRILAPLPARRGGCAGPNGESPPNPGGRP